MQPKNDNPILNVISLIANERVQQELGFSGPHLRGFKEAMLRVKDTFVPRIQALQKEPDSVKHKKRATLMGELVKEVDKVLADTLQPEQFERLQQLRFQKDGIAAFQNAKLAADLSLTPDQVERLKSVVKDGIMRISVAQRVPGQSSAEAHERAMESVMEILTDEQLGKLREKQGEPFDFGESDADMVQPAGPSVTRAGPSAAAAPAPAGSASQPARPSGAPAPGGPAGDPFSDEDIF
jgi:hypothetical protein